MTRPGRRRRADSRYAEQARRLAEWLRDRRVQAGMSQEQLAGQAQVAVATVRKIEKGAVIEPGYFTVLALMHALAASEDQARLGLTHIPLLYDVPRLECSGEGLRSGDRPGWTRSSSAELISRRLAGGSSSGLFLSGVD